MRSERAVVLLMLGLVTLCLAGCGPPPDPVWHSLLRVAPSEELFGRRPSWETLDGRRLELVREGSSLWLEVVLRREDWQLAGPPGLWKASMPMEGLGMPGARLTGAPGIHGLSPPPERGDGRNKVNKLIPPGYYHAFRGDMYLRWPSDEELPAEATLGLLLDLGRRGDDGAFQVHGRRFVGEGVWVLPGFPIQCEVEYPRDSTLRFATCVERALAHEVPGGTHVYRVAVDGETVFEHEQAHDERGSFAWHAVALPGEGRHRLTLEVTGPFAYTAFLAAGVGPTQIGGYAERPWGTRPSIVLFLADTFRADNLALYGGDPDIAPNLNTFAERCLRFQRAWSVGTSTLPAHVTMFSGWFPRQAATTTFAAQLPDGVETIAEHLRARGYRTGAVTDSAVVSLRFGFHQGFEWFDEEHVDLGSTLQRARAFLEADDGRPVFLFVHTYRTHMPYRAVETTPFRRGYDFPGGERERVFQELGKASRQEQPNAQERRRLEALADEVENLYRQGASDLDFGFSRLLVDLARLGLTDSGYLIFTSDHGEAFAEHGETTHGGAVFEEQIRIPLLISGPGLQPQTIPYAASLVDMATTISAMAGVAPHPTWLGSSLLDLGQDRTLFAFQGGRENERPTVAIIEGSRKLIGKESLDRRTLGEVWRAFDLDADPGELRDLLGSGLEWPARLETSSRTPVEVLLAPRVDPQASVLDEQHLEELRALGYVVDS